MCSTITTSTIIGAFTVTAPTVQNISTVGNQTYTPAAGVMRIRVRMCGGGGGGGGYTVAGSDGNPTYFGPAGTSRWVANAGFGAEGGSGDGYSGGNGGSGGQNASVGGNTLIARIAGGKGQGYSGVNATGGQGGTNPFGGAGAGAGNRATHACGWPGTTNTGAGGGGAASNYAYAAPGGGAGEYVEFFVSGPLPATIACTVGDGGAGGYYIMTIPPFTEICGGKGAAGNIIIEEMYI